MGESTPIPIFAGVLFVSGALRSIGFTAYNTLAFSDVDRAELTHANTLNAAVQELAAGLGVALVALVLTVFTSLATSSGHGFGSEYSWAFAVLGLLMLCTVIGVLRLPRDAGAAVTSR